MQGLNCNHCGHRAWYDEHEWGHSGMVSPEIEYRYYSDVQGQEMIDRCAGCGTALDLEEWGDRPGHESEYGLIKLLLIWVLRWAVIEPGSLVKAAAPGQPVARWDDERECWRVLAQASDLEDYEDFAPTQSFVDAWLLIELLQAQAEEDAALMLRYLRFLELINQRWQAAITARKLADGFTPWDIVFAVLDAFDL